jgi:WD40 repeat protein
MSDLEGFPPAPELTVAWSRQLDEYVATLCVSPDGERAAVGTSGGKVVVLETKTGRLSFECEAHAGGVLASSFCPRGLLLATGGHDGYARLFDDAGRERAAVSGGAPWVEHLGWSPRGDHWATGSGRTARVWTADGKPLFELPPSVATLGALGWNHAGTHLATASRGEVRIVEARRGSLVHQLRARGSLISLAYSPDDSVVACGSRECSVHFWRLTTAKHSQISGFVAQPRALSWAPDGKHLASSGGRSISLWPFEDGPEGRRPSLLAAHGALCTALSFHSALPHLASGGDDATVYVWRPREGLAPSGAGRMEETVTAIQWAPPAGLVLAADASGLIRAFSERI